MAKRMRRLGIALGGGLLVTIGGAVWVRATAHARLERTYGTHSIDVPVPYPGAGDPRATAEGDAMARAIARGRHLVRSRYGCTECHGDDFGGGTMIDDPAMGTILGPNLTGGRGSRTRGYTMRAWDRIVRHGVKPDGTPAVMPSEDFARMSDEELSDIVAFIRSLPPVDREVPPPSFGPVGLLLVATGKLPLSAETLAARAEHPARPPRPEPTATFGDHLAQPCRGCHRADMRGGPIAAGPLDWPPAANLTPHADGLAGWSYDEFARVMRTGVRPSGRKVRPPMAAVVSFTSKLSDVELRALWAYLSSLAPAPTGE